MDLTPYISTLREDLTTAASAGDDQTKRTAAVLAAALEPATRLAIMNALSDLAAEVTAALDDRVVEVRLDGRDVRVAVSGIHDHYLTDAPPPPPPPPPPPDPNGDISRITLRLFEQLKSQAERAASQQGVSLNAWLSQAVQSALHGGWDERGDDWQDRPDRRRGRRVRGWVQG
jgi:HicB family